LFTYRFIPILNVDGYLLFEKNINETFFPNIVKNNNAMQDKKCANPFDDGVDLKRNFGYQFTLADDECSENYGGKEPFSEAESAAIKHLIENFTSIRLNINLGGLFLFNIIFSDLNSWEIPYSFDNATGNVELP
jgi:hypothetical protein